MRQLSIFLALAIASATGAGQAMANSMKVNPPPIVLSPNLAAPWVNQLSPSTRLQGRKSKRRSFFSRRKSRNSASGSHIRARQPVATRQQPRATQPVRATQPRAQLDPTFLPTVVDYQTEHNPGTVIIDTASRHLYLVERNGRARRYGVGVGKQGFSWSGTERITRKAEWPTWRPPSEMIAREKRKGRNLPREMAGGPRNPLGARALYLGSTLYRIHGSNQPWTIGQAVSSGCIRMRNEDVTDFYNRVGIGTKVVVL